MAMHEKSFPNESPEYRAARDRLLKGESELRDRTEEVAALRRQLPLGGAVSQDYVFQEGGRDLRDSGTAREVRLSELFEGGKDTLLLYGYMFSPKMARPCPSCTSLIDGYNASLRNLLQRVNFAVVAQSPVERLREFARERGWHDVRLLSAAGNSYTRDYHCENANGDPLPIMNVFQRKNGTIYHTWSSELNFVPARPGQDHRHLDVVWPLWNLLDLTPEGRGTWNPKLSYDK